MIRILTGDCLDVLPTLPAESVHCVITSPPYWGLRDYGVDGQLGLERVHDCLGWATGQPCGECYVCHLVAVFREIRRVLRSDGTAWLVIGDSYAGSWGNYAPGGIKNQQRPQTEQGKRWERKAYDDTTRLPPTASVPGLKPKDLAMIPARVALALQADGWWVRSDIIWAKPNPMPESVTDRPTKAHEYVFLLAKSARYYFDQEAVREPHLATSIERAKYGFETDATKYDKENPDTAVGNMRNGSNPLHPNGRNIRTVWDISTSPYPDAHFATFPPALVEPCIKAGTSEKGVCPACGKPWTRMVETVGYDRQRWAPGENQYHTKAKGKHGTTSSFTTGDVAIKETIAWRPSCSCDAGDPIPATVLDPFCGAGTVGLVASRLGRNAVLIELNPVYSKMARKRITDDAPMFADVIVEATP